MTGDATAARGAGTLEIATRSGAVTIRARPVAAPEVIGGSAQIQPDGVVLAGASRSIEIVVPEGTDLVIGSSSGRVACHGRLGRVAVTGHSGRITIESATSVEVRSTSGRVRIEHCAEVCRVAAGSGRVEVGTAGSLDVTLTSGRIEAEAVGDAVVRSGSGRVELGLSRAGTVEVSSLSGKVTLRIPAGLAPELQLRSGSGRIRSEVRTGADGHISVESHSGSITVTQA